MMPFGQKFADTSDMSPATKRILGKEKNQLIPDGTYKGVWGGHELEFDFEGMRIVAITTKGVRGINIPVTFSVSDGKLDNDSIETYGDTN